MRATFGARRIGLRQCRRVLALVHEAERQQVPLTDWVLIRQLSGEMSHASVWRAVQTLKQVGLLIGVPAEAVVTNGHLSLELELRLTSAGRAAAEHSDDELRR